MSHGPEGMIVDISRASNVDEDALIAALGSAALDPRFLDLPNVLVQPHHASGSVEARKAMGRLVRDNLAAHFEGRELPTPIL